MARSKEDKTPGYKLQAVHVWDGKRLQYHELLLPETMADEIERWNLRAQQDRDLAEADRLGGRVDEETPMVTAAAKSRTATFASKKGQDIEAKRASLLERYQTDSKSLQSASDHELLSGEGDSRKVPSRVQVYDCEEPLKLLNASNATPDSDVRKRNDLLFKTFEEKGCFRRIGSPELNYQAMAENLQTLAMMHPNFREVIQLISEQLTLAQVQGKPLPVPPLLLSGPPGVGKTHFALSLKKALGRFLLTHSMDSSHTSADLLGSASNWGNTRPGLVFDLVCLGERADPIILLDEIDKGGDRIYGGQDPLAPLHSLLEPLTSMRVKDISAGMQFDSSHILWIATANHPERIPDSLLSRFQLFKIDEPSARDAIPMAQAISASVVQELDLPGFKRPGKSIALALAHLTPRKQNQALRQAVAKALLNRRDQLTLADLPSWVRDDEAEVEGGTTWLH
jgi:hypothetical protein